MDYRMPSYYNQFKCIADKCTATCCAGWAIVIDDKALETYNSIEGVDGDFVRNNIDYNEQIFKRCDGKCAFLNEDNLCNLITRMGEEKLCKTCARYPRHFEEYGNLVEAALSISCPVAARMIIDNVGTDKFLVRHTDAKSPHQKEVDSHLLDALLQVRKTMFGLMSDRSLGVWERIDKVLSLGERIQPIVYQYEKLGLKVRIAKYREDTLSKIRKMCNTSQTGKMHNMLARAAARAKNCNEEKSNKRRLMHDFIDMLLGLENINQEWPKIIDEVKEALYINLTAEEYDSLYIEFNDYMIHRQYEYEHIMNYFMYTYFLGGVYDYNVQAMVKMSVLSTLIIREMGFAHWISNSQVFTVEDNIRISYLYSRQLEHSDDNLMSLEGLLVAHPIFSTENMKNVL